MCGRVFIKTGIGQLVSAFADVQRAADDGLDDFGPRFNGAPGLEYPIIVKELDMPGAKFMRATWGLIPSWIKEAKPKVKPINAKAETVVTNAMFRGAYRSRRALMPIDGFFEWKAIKGQKAKQPFAIAMKDGSPFTLAAIWEKWKHPETGEEFRTFAIVTCTPNELMAEIHDRMPVIIAANDRGRWLDDEDPRDLMKPFPAELMTVWPISTKVNSPRNQGAGLLDRDDA